VRLPARDGPIARTAKQAGRFALHVLEMCVVMCVALGALGALFIGATLLGVPDDVPQQATELSAVVVAAGLASSMVVWMRMRHMEWRPTLETAGVVVPAAVLVVCRLPARHRS
jgi:uncharacterized membrane protein YfcA